MYLSSIILSFQVFDNAYDMLTAQWEDNRYAGFGVTIHRVPHDPSSTDTFKDADYESAKQYLAKSLVGAPSELVDEFRQIMRHFSSSLYRWQFVRCGSCPICPKRGPASTPLERFFERFGGDIPTPMPFMASFRGKAESGGTEPAHHMLVGSTRGSGERLHYRTLSDLFKLNITNDRLHADQHYEGGTPRHVCKRCKPGVSHRSAAALLRHVKMLHQ